ncbi:MAG: hypothetical protein ACXAC5_04040 [Promethearchaeota archaeon]|jgi:hypothetical protein
MNTLKRIWEYIKTVKYFRDWRYWTLLMLACLLLSPIDSFFIEFPLLVAISIGIMYGLDWYDERKD